MDPRKFLRAAFGVAIVALTSTPRLVGPAWAQADVAKDFPERPINVVVGYSPGGGNDLLARVAAQKMSEIFKQPVVVYNRPGASGRIAAEFVAKAKPDGYTLMVAPNGPLVVSPAVYQNLAYDTKRDFVPITEIALMPMILVVNAKSPIKSVQELVAYTKANPSKANYSSPSVSFQLANELLKLRTGMPSEMVAYKGSGDCIIAVISGQVLYSIVDTSPVFGHLEAGELRALAVTMPKRLPELPNVPTLEELGVKDANFVTWSGIFAPAGTPPAILAKLEAAARQAISSPDVDAKLHTMGVEPSGIPSDEFSRTIDRDLRQAVEVAGAANIKIEE